MNAKEFLRRRKTMLRIMGSDAIAIIPSAQIQTRSRSVDYPFRQDSDFVYLTGFEEPDAVCVLIPGRPHGEYILFCRENDAVQETFHGRRAGLEGAIEEFAADDAFPISDMDEILPGLLEGRARVYYTMGRYKDFDGKVLDWINRVRTLTRTDAETPSEFISLDFYLHDMRLYKSRAEIAAMRRAAKVSVAAHERAMRVCRPGLYEYELEAEMLHEYRRKDCCPAYPAIVAGGKSACDYLHYTENNKRLQDGDLVLIDAGAENDNYASDVSRTFPVSGVFSEVQREVYQVVLDAQLAAIKKCLPGNHLDDPHQAAVKVLTKGLVSLGILKGPVAKLVRSKAYQGFYMHRTNHWLGLDVHDVGDYKVDGEWRLLEPGMVMTIEPGLYIRPGKGVPKAFANMGIRIEDDVLISKAAPQVLTDALAKTPQEIEALMNH